MKGRSNSGRGGRPTGPTRVFVTPGISARASGGVYTLSGKPVSVPPAGPLRTPTPLGELDDWVPEPESYLPDDESFEEFVVSSGAGGVDVDVDDFVDEEIPWPSGGTPVPPMPPAPPAPIPAAFGSEELEHPGAPVMAPINPTWPGPYVGEEPRAASPVVIASSTSVRWKAK